MEGGEEEKVEESRVEAAAAGGRVDACETEWCHCDEAELLFCLSCNVPIVLPSCSSLPPVRRGAEHNVGLLVCLLAVWTLPLPTVTIVKSCKCCKVSQMHKTQSHSIRRRRSRRRRRGVGEVGGGGAEEEEEEEGEEKNSTLGTFA